MNKLLVLSLMLSVPLCANAASIHKCMTTGCLVTGDYTTVGFGSIGCKTYNETCYSDGTDYKVYDCGTCESGYTLTQQTITVSSDCGTKTVGRCVKNAGAVCTTGGTCSGTPALLDNCKMSTTECFGNTKVRTCTQCNTGYILNTSSISVDGCTNKYSQGVCTLNFEPIRCNALTCQSDTTWYLPSLGSVYGSKVNRACNKLNLCVETTVYSCADGYYGTATETSQECHKCPDGGTSTMGSNTAITDCYSTGGKDAAGKYDYNPDCPYEGE